MLDRGQAGAATNRSSFWTVYGFPLRLIAACILTVIAVSGRPGSSTTDFLVFYQSGRQLLAGGDAYLPFVPYRGPNLSPPWVVGLMSPLSRLPLTAAVVVWWTVSFACLGAAVALIANTVAPGRAVAIASAVLVTQAAFANVRLGQVAWPLMLLVTAAWWADRSQRPLLCGALLGVATSWKPFLLVFVPYLIWRREWRTLVAMAAAIVVTIAAGFLLLGASGYTSWFAVLQFVGWEGHPLNASLRGAITRALTSSTLIELHTTPIVNAPAWRDAAWLAISLIVAAVTVLRIVVRRDIDLAWAALGLLALLISPLGWVHYTPIVAGPVTAALAGARPVTRRLGVAGWLLLCVPFFWLKVTTFGPWLTLTAASSYMWGALLLLFAVLMA
jgi:hypothetical protein